MKAKVTWRDQNGDQQSRVVDMPSPGKTCPHEQWRDDGYARSCVRQRSHPGACRFGVWIRVPPFVEVSFTKRSG